MSKTRHLLPGQVMSLLGSGRSIEQWLGYFEAPAWRSFKWLAINPQPDGKFKVAVFEVFDDGDAEWLDVYAFEPVDPDFPGGVASVAESADEAVTAATGMGADNGKFVGAGMIQHVYAAFLQEYGPPAKK